MNKIKTRSARVKRTHKQTYSTKVASVRESSVVFFGSPNDAEVKESIRKAKLAGRKTELVARPSFDTGLGPCGKHVCSCKEVCKADYGKTLDAEFGRHDYQLGN